MRVFIGAVMLALMAVWYVTVGWYDGIRGIGGFYRCIAERSPHPDDAGYDDATGCQGDGWKRYVK